MPSHFDRAGRWFLHSGIREPRGGVARFYLTDRQANRPVSNEITGYAASAFVYLHSITGDPGYLDAARATAHFLVEDAWNPDLRAFPFEHRGDYSYFFDSGIIVRGLLAVWGATGEDGFLHIAAQCGRSMVADFRAANGEYHPILKLPEKAPAERDERWSRSPGCYQLKAALAWLDLAEATGDAAFERLYEDALAWSMARHGAFLPGSEERPRIMDRLHAYCYFLESLLPRADRRDCAAVLCGGIRNVSEYLRGIEPEFARSDVYAQLLRVRIQCDAAGIVPIDRDAAEYEARALASFQAQHEDRRIDGGFWFGSAAGELLPYVNPVSTAFGMQALGMWKQFQQGGEPPPRHLFI